MTGYLSSTGQLKRQVQLEIKSLCSKASDCLWVQLEIVHSCTAAEQFAYTLVIIVNTEYICTTVHLYNSLPKNENSAAIFYQNVTTCEQQWRPF